MTKFAIHYHPEGYSIDGNRIMGRQAAGASFLSGFLRYAVRDSSGPNYVYVAEKELAATYIDMLREQNHKSSNVVITKNNLGDLGNASGLYIPGPTISVDANLRRQFGDSQWSICGITHTTSSATAMDAISSWITSPVQSWDAVICTSNSVKKNVETVLQAQVDSLRERLGITKIVLPQLPIIPLGIHTKDFACSLQQRATARSRLGVKDEELLVLYMGRLSFHAKAHPLAMYQALENAAKTTGKKVTLIECGWHANEYIERAFTSAAKLASPSIRVINLDGRKAVDREAAWASADVFCSLSDNIQETFGIVPLEAMAAGLPVVVSDWDGYKETVRDGIDGFRIPTLAPSPGLGGDLAHRHALEIDTYDMYCGHNSSLVAVHSQKLSQAFIELFQSPELRKKMGEAGRRRVTQNFDWRTIIPKYEELWAEQTKIRLAVRKAHEDGDKKSGKPPPLWPARLDPTIGFKSYPTQHLTTATELLLTEPSAAKALQKLNMYKELAMVNYAQLVFPTDEEIRKVLKAAESCLPNSCTVRSLLVDIDLQRRPYVHRGLAWLCKLGLFQFS